jgi:hypothetical protein
MKRISLFVAGALACLAVAPAGAGAAPAESVKPLVTHQCHDEVSNIQGGRALISVVAAHVTHAHVADTTCGKADAVFTDVTAQQLTTPANVDRFHVVPTVLSAEPLEVEYRCALHGDGKTEVVVVFKVTYN